MIRQLPAELALPVTVFYLVLRALDTIEDDMDLAKFRAVIARCLAMLYHQPSDHDAAGLLQLLECRGGPFADGAAVTAAADAVDAENVSAGASNVVVVKFKVAMLRQFSAWLSDDAALPAAAMANLIGEADEADLLSRFDAVQRVFRALPQAHRSIIEDVTQRMADGMAEYIDKDLRQGTENTADYSHYCHIVAGLVGEGLSRQFAACGLEPQSVSAVLAVDGGKDSLSYHMGLMLQKTNIMRDYLEDFLDGRAFWPKDVWRLYAPHESGQQLLGSLAQVWVGTCLDVF